MTKETAYTAMLTKNDIKGLKPKILHVLQETFPTMDITDIYLRLDEGYDGDPILRVYIGYSGTRPEGVVVRAEAISKILELLSRTRNTEEFPVTTWLKTTNFLKAQKKTDSEKHEGGFYNLA